MKGFLKSKLFWLVLVALVLVILFQIGIFPTGTSSEYQAVFLSNNQVYFGKLSNPRSAYPTLRDIYYLQVTQPLQPVDLSQSQSQINLVKLGGELHGPKDEMMINKDHILFIENLKDDSRVVNSIKDYKKSQN